MDLTQILQLFGVGQKSGNGGVPPAAPDVSQPAAVAPVAPVVPVQQAQPAAMPVNSLNAPADSSLLGFLKQIQGAQQGNQQAPANPRPGTVFGMLKQLNLGN